MCAVSRCQDPWIGAMCSATQRPLGRLSIAVQGISAPKGPLPAQARLGLWHWIMESGGFNSKLVNIKGLAEAANIARYGSAPSRLSCAGHIMPGVLISALCIIMLIAVADPEFPTSVSKMLIEMRRFGLCMPSGKVHAWQHVTV